MSQEFDVYEQVKVALQVNGREHVVAVEPRETLVDTLRDRLVLTGTHIGCEQGVCGACTVIVDGSPARACILYTVQTEGRDIWTIEGIQGEPGVTVVQDAFSRHHALQCGFCTPGFLMLARWGLSETCPGRRPSPEALAATNICRCGCYQGIRQALREVDEARIDSDPVEPTEEGQK